MKATQLVRRAKLKGGGQKATSFLIRIACISLICWLPLIGGLGMSYAQNVGINTTGAAPNAKALLDLDANATTKAGLLVPRMTTAQRATITAPIPESLLIYNTTTQCFEAWNQTALTWVAFGCIGCAVPTAVTASAAPNPICVGSTLTLTGGATNATSWNWTGPNGFSSILQNPTITTITTASAGVYTLTASNACAAAAPVSTASVTVSAAPTSASAGSDINPACGVTTVTLAGNTPTTGTGLWSVVSGTATITTPTSPTSGVTGLAVSGTAVLRWTISNAPCAASSDDVVITTSTCAVLHCGVATATVDVTNVFTGKTWMDRNLGASQVATSSTDAAAYGCLYQWGRLTDGHESRTSGTTATLSPTDVPGHANFITTSVLPNDWRSPQNNSLWQGVAGINNPCPAGYRLPTEPELEAERLSWVQPPISSVNSSVGAFASPLRLSVGGNRQNTGAPSGVGTTGFYWSSSINGANGRYLNFLSTSTSAFMSSGRKASGMSVRCIKN